MKKHLIVLGLIALLPACATEAPARIQADIPAAATVNLDVATVSVIDRSTTRLANSPFNSNHFSPSIVEAVQQWAKNKIRAVGTAGQAIVVIKDASLTLQALPHENDWFTRQQTSKYNAHIEVEVEAKNSRGYAIATAQTTHTESLPENPTDAERQNAYFTVLNASMRDLEQNMHSSVHEHMQNFVITAPILNNGPRTVRP